MMNTTTRETRMEQLKKVHEMYVAYANDLFMSALPDEDYTPILTEEESDKVFANLENYQFGSDLYEAITYTVPTVTMPTIIDEFTVEEVEFLTGLFDEPTTDIELEQTLIDAIIGLEEADKELIDIFMDIPESIEEELPWN